MVRRPAQIQYSNAASNEVDRLMHRHSAGKSDHDRRFYSLRLDGDAEHVVASIARDSVIARLP